MVKFGEYVFLVGNIFGIICGLVVLYGVYLQMHIARQDSAGNPVVGTIKAIQLLLGAAFVAVSIGGLFVYFGG